MLVVGLGTLTAIGLMFMLVAPASASSTPWLLITVMVILLLMVPLVLLISRSTRDEAQSKAKGKRGLEGLDMYSVIDRMVDDLDSDEAAYLQRRLDEREAKQKDDLTVSLDEVLNQRAQDRQED